VIDDSADLLLPGPIKAIKVDITTRCNLRCVYCAVSSKRYVGTDMPAEIVKKSISLISNLRPQYPDLQVFLNGNGETTYRTDWTNLVAPLLESGIMVRLQSNFAKEFSERELEVLSCMNVITISVDTADRALLAKLRRHVDIRQIITNIAMVRATAVRMLRKPPTFTFACGLYDRNSLFVDGLARLAISLRIRAVNFWNLHDHGHTDNNVDEGERVHPLDDLTDVELRPRVEAIRRAIELLRAHHVVVGIHAGFVNILARRVGLDA
jgi:MoaA/NifB/PqqE/SkfB family radical SAM enzyme